MKEQKEQLLSELKLLREKGVRISIEGVEVNPERIIDEFMIFEESNYMRDYILDENGKLIELGFNNVNS